jgi:ABC-type transport system involved in multi-copper enzyme maturation permease subunit
VIWVTWRRQRTETLVTAGLLALLAALLVPTGIEMASAFHHDGLASCLGAQPGQACESALASFNSRFDSLNSLIAWLTLVPGIIGILLAAPLVLELEHRTHRLAWTQSVSRARWLAGKLGLAVVVALAASLVFTLLVTWWRAPIVRIEGRLDQSVFDSEGIVVFGYTLFALGLAASVGVVWRRAAASLVVGFVGYFAVRVFVDTWLRQRLVSPRTATLHMLNAGPAELRHAWVLNQYPSDRAGHHIPIPFGLCRPSPAGGGRPEIGNCLASHGVFLHATYFPPSSFWELQGIETALFAGTALLLLAFAAWWTYRRAD